LSFTIIIKVINGSTQKGTRKRHTTLRPVWKFSIFF
jgi:hypothetical protein